MENESVSFERCTQSLLSVIGTVESMPLRAAILYIAAARARGFWSGNGHAQRVNLSRTGARFLLRKSPPQQAHRTLDRSARGGTKRVTIASMVSVIRRPPFARGRPALPARCAAAGWSSAIVGRSLGGRAERTRSGGCYPSDARARGSVAGTPPASRRTSA